MLLSSTTKYSIKQFTLIEVLCLFILYFFKRSHKLYKEKSLIDSYYLKNIKIKRDFMYYKFILENNINFLLRKESSDQNVYEEIFDYNCYSFVSDYLNGIASPLILDLGANIGLASVYFSQFCTGGTYICVEPNQDNINTLIINLNSNHLNHKVVNKGIWHETTNMFLEKTSESWTACLKNQNKGNNSQLIETTTISNIIDEYRINNIDLIKIDIEGSEYNLFFESKCLDFLYITKSIIIEIHDYKTFDIYLKLLRSYKFNVTVHSDVIFAYK